MGAVDGGRDIQIRGRSRGVTDVFAETTEMLDGTFPLLRPGDVLPVYHSLLSLSSVIFYLACEVVFMYFRASHAIR